MIFKLHYWCLAAGINAVGYLLGVFLQTYTDASLSEIGLLLMLMPFSALIFKPIICSMADRAQAHKKYMMCCLIFTCLSYSPFLVIPFIGPQLYQVYPRACWYVLVAAKIAGDIALGGVVAIGDSLAVNYARRINTEFSVYRVWGTLSWMTFGLIIGQINETPSLPRYTPAFLILIGSSLLNLFIIWLWPDEYFRMVPHNSALEDEECSQQGKKTNKFTKSLLPRQVVQAHMRAKLVGLFSGCFCKSRDVEAQKSALAIKLEDGVKGQQTVALNKEKTLSKTLQIKILFLLLRRDPRIMLYCTLFLVAGLGAAAMSFFIMSLSPICHEQGTCDFSVLAGMLQASMAAAESILFMSVARIQRAVGRINLGCIILLAYAIRYLFYGIFFEHVSPNYSLVAEMLQGISYGSTLTLMVEMAHLFANEVEFILPELIERGIVEPGADAEPLKLSLSATMQAFVSGFHDGIGKGIGALLYGFMLERMSYTMLWYIIGVGATVALVVLMTVNILDHIFKFNLGGRMTKQAAEVKCQSPGCELNKEKEVC